MITYYYDPDEGHFEYLFNFTPTIYKADLEGMEPVFDRLLLLAVL